MDEFFKIEKEYMNQDYKKVCTDDKKLYGKYILILIKLEYFYNLSAMILYNLLPMDDFNNNLLRFSLQVFKYLCILVDFRI